MGISLVDLYNIEQQIEGQQQWAQLFNVLAGMTGNQVDIIALVEQVGNLLLRVEGEVQANTQLLNLIITNQGNDLTLIQASLNPIQLPPTPPAAYTPPSPGDNAVGVWNYILPTSGVRAADALAIAGLFPVNLTDAYLAFPAADVPYVSMYVNWESGYPIHPASSVTAADPHLILPTDANILAFLNRIDGAGTWALGPQGFPYQNGLPGSGGQQYVYTMGEADFLAWQGINAAAAATAPVWPGLAKVTLGTAVALVDGLTIAGPLDGVLVHLTSVPPIKTGYHFGAGEVDWYRIGALAFKSDDGQFEPPQLLGFEHALYCPRQMVHADAVVFRLQGALVGTVTPWVKT